MVHADPRGAARVADRPAGAGALPVTHPSPLFTFSPYHFFTSLSEVDGSDRKLRAEEAGNLANNRHRGAVAQVCTAATCVPPAPPHRSTQRQLTRSLRDSLWQA